VSQIKVVSRFSVIGCVLLGASVAQAQSAGDSVTLNYGTVESVQTVQKTGSRTGGTLAGGMAGAVIARNHRGLGAIVGGLIGGSIEKHHTQGTLQLYKVKLVNGGTVAIDTEQEDIRIGDCVVVEQGKYANVRRVSDVNCRVSQQPKHHVEAANNCQKAKDELNNADTDDAIEHAVIKVRTLCED